jgi:hypothetical protein
MRDLQPSIETNVEESLALAKAMAGMAATRRYACRTRSAPGRDRAEWQGAALL